MSHSALDVPWPLTILPGEADGWSGTPGWAGHRGGSAGAVRWHDVSCVLEGTTIATRATSADGIRLELRHELDADGVLRVRASVTNDGQAAAPLDVAALRSVLPLPARADEVLDLTGRWCRERSPQRSRLDHGTHLRASRRGRTGHDATLLMVAGTAGFGWRTGEVWAVHTAWSGNHEHLVEALPEGAGRHRAVIGGGELLAPGEVRLAPGETYAAPTVVFVHATDGLDGLSRRLHRSLRARPTHPTRPRPVVLNTWEAVYFETDLDHLLSLADVAARVGVERFVLDDGWFGGRRNDTVGLGDWVVSPDVWPDGLAPLVDHVKGLGLEFGLWFEPEMVNEDSDLVRAHPDWVLRPRDGSPREWRSQQLIDLTNDDARAELLERISGLVGQYGIDYIKWDHNRDLHEAVHTAVIDGRPVVDAPAVHAHTLAFYRLLDDLRARHVGLEIESCSSGGARVDLGVLDRTDRIWTSDCNDAAGACEHPALDLAARAGRAHGHPRRPPGGAHDPPRRRPRLPAAHGPAGSCRPRVGHHDVLGRGARDVDGLDGARPRAAAAAALGRPRAGRDRRRHRPGDRAPSRATGGGRCSRWRGSSPVATP